MLLAPHIHWIEGVRANVFALIEPSGVTLIDTGAPSIDRIDLIFNFLQRHDKYPLDVKRILLTHADGDSAGNVKGIIDETGAIVLASPEAKNHLVNGTQPDHLPPVRQWLAKRWVGLPAVSVEKIRVLDKSNRNLPILGGLEVIPTPGHTPDSVSFFHSKSGVLFAGDALSGQGGRLGVPPVTHTADIGQAKRSALKLLKRCPTVIASGHGKPLTAHHAFDIYHQLSQWEQKD